MVILSGLIGCETGPGYDGDPPDASADDPDGIVITGDTVPPLFEYTPGVPGRTTGVRAIVTMGGEEMVSNPVEMVLLPPDAVAPVSNQKVSAPTSGDGSEMMGAHFLGLRNPPTPGEEVEAIGTLDGKVCFMSYSVSGGALGTAESLSALLLFGREGVYKMGSFSTLVYIPPDLANVAHSVGAGCIAGDRPDEISADYLRSLSALTLSYSIFIYSQGYTAYLSEGRGPVRAYQYSTGVAASAGLFSLSPASIGMSLEVSSTPSGPFGPRFISPWPYSQGGDGPLGLAPPSSESNGLSSITTESYALEVTNALSFALHGLRSMEGLEDASYETLLLREMAASALPVFEELGQPGVGGLTENVPAATNADFMADFLSRSGTDLIADAPNTSVDGLTQELWASITAAGDDTAAIYRAGIESQHKFTYALPSSLALSAVLSEAQSVLPLADELETWLTPEPDEERYVTPRIEPIEIAAGEAAEIHLRAEDVATLLGRRIEDVIGATVRVTAGIDVIDESFTLSDDLGLQITPATNSLLVKFDVNLGTAEGDFPPDVSKWLVRPAMYLIRTRAGDPATAFLNGPGRFAAGGPASLSVGVVDHEGRLVQRPFTATFVDAEGTPIGSADAEHGIARFQYIPEPTRPRIESISSTTLLLNEQEVSGFEIAGTGFSEDATVIINGTPISEASPMNVESPERILVVFSDADMTPGTGAADIIIENPEGARSEPVQFGEGLFARWPVTGRFQ